MTSRVLELLAGLCKPTGVIFTFEGQPIRRIKTGWAGALRRAGLPHYRFHDLRHTFNSRLGDLGIIADVRKELMGHSRGGDVQSIYTHIELPTLRDAIHRLETWHAEKVRSLEAQQLETSSTNNQNPKPLQPEDQPNDKSERPITAT